jgi:hypothetical protein
VLREGPKFLDPKSTKSSAQLATRRTIHVKNLTFLTYGAVMRLLIPALLLALGCSGQTGAHGFADGEGGEPTVAGTAGAPTATGGTASAGTAGQPTASAGTPGQAGGTAQGGTSGASAGAAGHPATAGQGGAAGGQPEGCAGGEADQPADPLGCEPMGEATWQVLTVQPGECLWAGGSVAGAVVWSDTTPTNGKCDAKQSSKVSVRPGADGAVITLALLVADPTLAPVTNFEGVQEDGKPFCGNLPVGVNL